MQHLQRGARGKSILPNSDFPSHDVIKLFFAITPYFNLRAAAVAAAEATKFAPNCGGGGGGSPFTHVTRSSRATLLRGLPYRTS